MTVVVYRFPTESATSIFVPLVFLLLEFTTLFLLLPLYSLNFSPFHIVSTLFEIILIFPSSLPSLILSYSHPSPHPLILPSYLLLFLLLLLSYDIISSSPPFYSLFFFLLVSFPLSNLLYSSFHFSISPLNFHLSGDQR